MSSTLKEKKINQEAIRLKLNQNEIRETHQKLIKLNIQLYFVGFNKN